MGLLFIKGSPVKLYSYENDLNGVFDALHQSFLVYLCFFFGLFVCFFLLLLLLFCCCCFFVCVFLLFLLFFVLFFFFFFFFFVAFCFVFCFFVFFVTFCFFVFLFFISWPLRDSNLCEQGHVNNMRQKLEGRKIRGTFWNSLPSVRFRVS